MLLMFSHSSRKAFVAFQCDFGNVRKVHGKFDIANWNVCSSKRYRTLLASVVFTSEHFRLFYFLETLTIYLLRIYANRMTQSIAKWRHWCWQWNSLLPIRRLSKEPPCECLVHRKKINTKNKAALDNSAGYQWSRFVFFSWTSRFCEKW